MNYQKLFSRFYSSAEQANGDFLQKYTGFSGNFSNFSGLSSEEVTSTGVVENGTENAEFLEFQTPIEPEDDEVMFVNQDPSDEASQTWEIPSSEDTMAVVEPLTPEEVRWFYKLKGDKIWTEFNGYDSLLIEEKYRSLPPIPAEDSHPTIPVTEDLASALKFSSDDEEHAFVSSPPGKKDDDHFSTPKKTGRSSHMDESRGSCSESSDYKSPAKHDLKFNSDESSEESFDDDGTINLEKIVVRGGLYEVDVAKMICESIYWQGEKYTITRGLYFYDGSWQPLERAHGEALEAEHLGLFGQKTCENIERQSTVPGVAVHSQYFSRFHVEWMSCCEIYLYWGGAPRQLVRSVTQKLGFYQSTGYRLRRGYRTLASISERPPDITHVVFVIHGIGQKMDEGRIIRNTNSLRGICEWLRVHHPSGGLGRAELFPARWRAGARGRAAGLLAAAAPPAAPALRRAINEAAMDVMYYTSPLYGRQVQDDLRKELNRLYTMFMARNPHYSGHFSAVAHSLGSVILYDIIINYQLGCDHCAGTSNLPKLRLLFPLQQLFCLGSPLSVFLAMRYPNPSLCAVLPQEFTPRLFNVFHLSDPVAYRLEPLISRFHAEQPPVVILPYHTTPTTNSLSPARAGSWRLWSYVKHPWNKPTDTGPPHDSPSKSNKTVETENTNIQSCAHPENEQSIACESATVTCCGSKTKSADKRKESICPDKACDFRSLGPKKLGKERCSRKNSICCEARCSELCKEGENILPYRLDYSLRDTGMANNYLSAITSHTSYWNNYDVAHFILSNLLPEMGDDEET